MKKLSIILLFPLYVFSQNTAKYNTGLSVDQGGNITANSISVTTGNTLVYRYTVGGGTCKFPTLDSAFSWLRTNMAAPSELLLDGGTHSVSDSLTVLFPYFLSIRGLEFQASTVQAATGLTNKPMFNIYTNCGFERITFDGSALASYGTVAGENGFNIINSGLYIEFKDCEADNFYYGINKTGNSEIFVFDAIFTTMVAGVMVNAAGATGIDIEITNFESCERGISLTKSNKGDFVINTVVFLQEAGDTAIWYDGANYVYNDIASILNCQYNYLGVFSYGFDFAATDGRDANIFMQGNVGEEDKKPHAKVNLLNNSATQAITATTWTKVAFTKTNSYTCKFFIGTDSITYQPKSSADMLMWLSGSIYTTTQPANVTIAIVRNAATATLYGRMQIFLDANSRAFNYSTNVYIDDCALGDDFSIWVYTAGNETLVFQDIAWLIRSQ